MLADLIGLLLIPDLIITFSRSTGLYHMGNFIGKNRHELIQHFRHECYYKIGDEQKADKICEHMLHLMDQDMNFLYSFHRQSSDYWISVCGKT